MRFRDRLVGHWYAPQPTVLSTLLVPLAWLFGSVVALRRSLFRAGVLRSARIGVPVVVVGNLTAGGAGKTPLVIALAQALAARGHRPGLVSRGYGSASATARAVDPHDDPSLVGDEPLLLAATGFPTWIGHDRVAAARGLKTAHPDCNVIVSDDGLQHYRLQRALEIAVVDEARGFGNGRLLPAGPLREPASRLDAVDAVVRLVADREPHNARGARDTTMTHEAAGFRNLVDPARSFDASAWPKGSVHAIAGIGHPQRFFDLLSRLGIEAIPHVFADHHAYTRADLDIPGAQAILMTAKDAVKCARFRDARLFALDIRAAIDPALVDLVERCIDGRQAA